MTRRILIIDDEDSIRDILQAALEDIAAWKTILAASGQEGLEKCSLEQPEAILLDISMPDMDGVQLYEQLQANPMTQSIPVILLTAKVLPSDRAQFADMGVAGTIIKPFNPMMICHQIADILGWALM